jgi:hypothetical protein
MVDLHTSRYAVLTRIIQLLTVLLRARGIGDYQCSVQASHEFSSTTMIQSLIVRASRAQIDKYSSLYVM